MIARSIIVLALVVFTGSGWVSGAEPSSMGVPISVPFQFYHGEIIVQGKINGQGPFDMMLDTGADPSVINLSTARQLGLKIEATGGPGDGTGTDVNLAYGTALPSVELGGLRATNLEAVAMDLSKVSRKIGRPIAAVLGYSLLKNRVFQFDYPGQVARFLPSTPYPDGQATNSAKVTTVSFRYQNDIVADGVVVNGKKMLANVDTGCNSAFQLTPAAVIEAGLQNAPTTPRQSVGFNGAATSGEGKISSVTVGGISVTNPTATFFNKGSGYDNEPWGIRLGNDFLKGYIVTFDFQAMKISLERP